MENRIQLKLKKRVFNDAYFPYLLDYSHRYEVYFGGAGSGKSVFVFQKVLIKACKDKRRVLVVRKVGNTHLNSTFTNLTNILSQFKIYGLCNINKSTMKITLPNESEFIFVGCDDVEKLKSIADITDIVVEEATELSLDDVSQLDLRLRARVENLQMFFMFNPTSKANWVYQKWFSPDVKIDDNTFVLKTTYKDNRFLPLDYISSLEGMIKTNPTYYKIYALGDFTSLDRLVYTNWRVEDFKREDLGALPLMCGLDFGFFNDPSAFIASLIDEDAKRIYIFKEWGSTGKTNPELAEIITSLGFAKSVIICDSAEGKSIEELRRNGLYRVRASIKGPDSIIYGVQQLQQYELVVHPSCHEVITELENYSWQKDRSTGEYINKPIDAFNHYLDALRYSIQCVKKPQLQTISKRVFGL
jgi:phage terminase large subunit